MLSKFLAMVFVVLVAISIQIATMMLGWGLQPKSWWWIVGAGFFGNVMVKILADKL
jgi:hypothetical protein